MTDTPLSNAELEGYIGGALQPPPTDRPAARALYFVWAATSIPKQRADSVFLVGGIPDALERLREDTHRLRMRYISDTAGLIALAKQEANNA